MNLSAGLASAGGMDSSLPILSLSAAAIAGAAAAFPKLQARLALSRAKHRSLTGHSKMSKMVARLVPHYEFDIDDFFRSDGAPRRGRHAAPGRLLPARRPLRGALRQGPADDGGGGRAHLRPAIHRNLPGAVPVQPAGARASRHRRLRAVLGRRHRHRCRRQCLLRPDRLLRRQHLRQRLLQGMHRRRPRSARMRSARCSAPTTPSSPTTCSGCARFPGSTKSRSTCPAPKP